MPTVKEARHNRRLYKAIRRRASDSHIDPITGKKTTGIPLRQIIERKTEQLAKIDKKKETRRRMRKRSKWQREAAREAFELKLQRDGNHIVNGQVVATKEGA